MVFYVIGPSGGGKTSCASFVSQELGITHFDLDSLCKGNEFNWEVCSKTLQQIEKQTSDGPVVVDIGAGTQTLPPLCDFLKDKTNRLLLVYTDPTEGIGRNPLGPERLLAEYVTTEYVSREKLYALAEHKIDITGKSLAESRKMFLEEFSRLAVEKIPS